MLPIALDPTKLRVGLIGQGEPLARRRAFLKASGVETTGETIGASQILFIAGFDRETSASLAQKARAQGALVNVEDAPELCDFHVPATARRGDLTFTVSTNGKAPALSRMLREWLERSFGIEWSERLDRLARARGQWRIEGVGPHEVARRSRDLVVRNGWLP